MANFWTAASEGNLARVKELVEEGLSPNALDENSYSGLHAAVSWNHEDILRYLVAAGGNINLVDDDGETPLFVAENVEIAQVAVELGADVDWTNKEGLKAYEVVADDYPELCEYLKCHSEVAPAAKRAREGSHDGTEEAEELDAPTDDLIAQTQTIMQSAERGELTETEVDDKLRDAILEAMSKDSHPKE